MPIAAGQTLNNRYRIESVLEQGAITTLYLAHDEVGDIQVAIKENPDTSLDARINSEREAKILMQLVHPNLPRVSDYFAVPGQGQYLVIEHATGETLQIRLSRGALPAPQVLAWADQLCAALMCLHEQDPPIIHGDIKPANILIHPDGRMLLQGAGLNRVYASYLKLTLGDKAVTPGYSPPEQYGGGIATIQSDIYALGATLYHLLTGKQLPDSKQRVASDIPVISPRKLVPHIGPSVDQAILKAIDIAAYRRFQSVAELRQALGQAPAEIETRLPPPVMPETIPEPPISEPILPTPISLEEAAALIYDRPSEEAQELAPPPQVVEQTPAPSSEAAEVIAEPLKPPPPSQPQIQPKPPIVPKFAPTAKSRPEPKAAIKRLPPKRKRGKTALFVIIGGLVALWVACCATCVFCAQTPSTPTESRTITATPGILQAQKTLPDIPPATAPPSSPIQTSDAAQELQTAKRWPLRNYEIFNYNSKSWPLGQHDYTQGKLELSLNNEYVWQVYAQQSLFAWARPELDPVTDFLLSVEVRPIGQTKGYCGLTFRQNDDQLCAFLISEDAYQVAFYDGSKWDTFINWTQAPALKQGRSNQLTVIAKETRFIFFINEVYVGQANIASPRSGRVGLAAQVDAGDSRFAFDNFALRAPKSQ